MVAIVTGGADSWVIITVFLWHNMFDMHALFLYVFFGGCSYNEHTISMPPLSCLVQSLAASVLHVLRILVDFGLRGENSSISVAKETVCMLCGRIGCVFLGEPGISSNALAGSIFQHPIMLRAGTIHSNS